MKKKKLKAVYAALLEIKSGNRSVKNGICNNLYFKVDSTDTVEKFIAFCFEKKYGDPDIMYPIEGDRYIHTFDRDKWNPETKFGQLRFELLDFMLETCEGLL